MGWSGIYNVPSDKKAYLINQFSYENEEAAVKVIDIGVVGSTYYLAVKCVLKQEGIDFGQCYQKEADGSFVYGMVILTSSKNGEFMYKSMDESAIPYYFDAPARIMKKLSPLLASEAGSYSFDGVAKWRAAVAEAKAAKKAVAKLAPGTKIKLKEVLTFGNGKFKEDTFSVPAAGSFKGKRNIMWSATIGYVRLKVSDYEYEIIK